MKEHLLNFAKGCAMGIADVIPGVSGGTVALLTGIYATLIHSISQFNVTWVGHLRGRRWREAFAHVNGRFLIALFGGILCGLVVCVKTLGHLLQQPDSRGVVLAAFSGMVVAAAIIVWRLVSREDRAAGRQVLAGRETVAGPVSSAHPVSTVRPVSFQRRLGALIVGVIAAGVIAFGQPVSASTIAPSYALVCGFVGICAMILPGISGALLLMLLGAYDPILGVAHELLEFQNVLANITIVLLFAIGAALGLALASRLLRWLLQRYKTVTLSLLCGLMLGSLPMLWPWQFVADADFGGRGKKLFGRYWPESIDRWFWIYLGTAAVACAVVLAVEWWAERRNQADDRRRT